MAIHLSINFPNLPVFLFPPSLSQDTVTTLRGEIHAEVDVETEVGPLVVVWEVAVERKVGDNWQNRRVARFWRGRVADPGPILVPGLTKIPFEFDIPSATGASRETPFDKCVHTIFASFLDAVPDYNSKSQPLNAATAFLSPEMARRGSGSRGPTRPGTPTNSGNNPFRDKPSGSSGILGGNTTGSPVSSNNKKARPFFRLFGAKKVDKKPKSRNNLEGQGDKHDGYEEEEHVPDLPLDCEPSKASCAITIDVITCWNLQSAQDFLQYLSWTMDKVVPGLGYLKFSAYSDLLVVGSGFNMALELQDLEPKATIHSITVTMQQKTKSADGEQHALDDFTVYKIGQPTPPVGPPKPDEYVWRGDVRKAIDAALHHDGNRRSSGPADPLPDIPGSTSTSDSWALATLCRLPSPAIGALARWGYFPERDLYGVTEHFLKFEMYYSILGQDEAGNEIPTSEGEDPKGILRRFWVDHHITLNDCNASPTNIVVPTYVSATTAALEDGERRSSTSKDIPRSFTMPVRMTRGAIGKRDRVVNHQTRLSERIDKHRAETDGVYVL